MKSPVATSAKEGSLAEAMLSPTPSVEPSGGACQGREATNNVLFTGKKDEHDGHGWKNDVNRWV